MTSKVYLGLDLLNNHKKVAIKTIKSDYYSSEHGMAQILKEVAIHKSLNHPNINKLISSGSNGQIITKN